MRNFALMGAIALTSAIGFTACSSSEDATEPTTNVNPTFDGTSVRTDFAFNITKASQGTTRMTAANVQEGTSWTFRGLQDMYLYAMKTTNPSTEPNGEDALQTYALQSISSGTLDDNSTTTPPSSKVYPLSIPVGTNNFLFYARALKNGETNFEIGKVTFNNLSASSKATGIISFSLAPIETPTGVATPIATTQTNFITYLNSIAEAKDVNNNTWAGTVSKAATDGRYSAIAKLYNGFARPDLNVGEVRSGSAESIMRTVRDLYTSMKGIVELSSTTASTEEAEIHNIAWAVCTAIEADFFDLTAPASGLPDQSNPYNIAWKSSVAASAQTYPASYDLPMGASQLVWNSSNSKIEYADFDYSNPAVTSGFSGVPISKMTYPAELLYFDNSPLRSTNQYKEVNDYPVTTTGWDAALGGSGAFDDSWTGTSVTPATRAVAMKNNVNYGVALLQSTVAIKSGVTKFVDNQQSLIGAAQNNEFTISDINVGSGIELTGILIGGQPGTVNWKMLPSSTAYDYAIYDKNLDNTAGSNWEINKNNSSLSTLYTVCFDNYISSGDQNDVCIALEFKNNLGQDFYGAKGLIPAGSTFYLVGKLSPASGGTWTDPYSSMTDYRVSNSNTARVFAQDFKTVATFNLTETSLQNAYSTVPDLRSTEMLFGLSVDLTWQHGLTFNVDL